jgi:hypothetical protein
LGAGILALPHVAVPLRCHADKQEIAMFKSKQRLIVIPLGGTID